MLVGSKVADISAHLAACQVEIIDKGRDMLKVHIVVVDTIRWIAMLALLDYKIEIVNLHIANIERKPTLRLILSLGESAIDHLLDIDYIFGSLSQIQNSILHRTIAQRDTPRTVNAREIDFQLTNIEQGVTLIILNIKPLNTQATHQANAYLVDSDGCL